MSNYSNNNGYGNPNISNNNGYGNPNNSNGNWYGNNPNNQNNSVYGYNQNYNTSRPSEKLLNSMKSASIAYIVLFFITIILIVAGYVMVISGAVSATYHYDNYGNIVVDDSFIVSVGYGFIGIGVLCSFCLFITGIILAIRSGNLKNYLRNDFNAIFVLSVIGIFVGFLSLIAAFMAISKVNMIRR